MALHHVAAQALLGEESFARLAIAGRMGVEGGGVPGPERSGELVELFGRKGEGRHSSVSAFPHDLPSSLNESADEAVDIRRAFSAERYVICDWLAREFNQTWAAEGAGCFCGGRVSCFVATRDEKLVGVACYDTTARGISRS